MIKGLQTKHSELIRVNSCNQWQKKALYFDKTVIHL